MDKQKDAPKLRNGITTLFWFLMLALFIYSIQTIIDFETLTNPARHDSFIRVLTALSKPKLHDAELVRQVSEQMWETVQVAFLATTISAILAIPISLISARNSSRLGRALNAIVQPIASIVRAVHPLIITIPTVLLAGIGPTAGVLTLTLFSTAVLIGHFSEYAQQHLSLSWASLFKVHFPALAFKQLPVNLVTASILGFLGGGGIGSLILLKNSLLDYRASSVAMLACMIVIGSIDLVSRAVWRRIQNSLSERNPV